MIWCECEKCGGVDVIIDATLYWSKDRQEWVIRNVFDGVGVCVDCACDVLIDWKVEGLDDDSDGSTKELSP